MPPDVGAIRTGRGRVFESGPSRIWGIVSCEIGGKRSGRFVEQRKAA